MYICTHNINLKRDQSVNDSFCFVAYKRNLI